MKREMEFHKQKKQIEPRHKQTSTDENTSRKTAFNSTYYNNYYE